MLCLPNLTSEQNKHLQRKGKRARRSMEHGREEQKLDHLKGQTRLPKFAAPKHYDLTLKLDLLACTFLGSVSIDLSIIQATKFLVLNALELVIHQVSFASSQNQKHVPSDIVVYSDDEILVLVFDETLSAGDGTLAISFSGSLNEHMKGLYRCTYVDGGEKKNMAVTQFEAVEARRCFPCWDEPALKATFKITVDDVPSQLTTLSNMPVLRENLNGNFKTLYFEQSPPMSTYLVAIVVGLFDYIEDTTPDGIKVRVYAPVGESQKGYFALNVAMKALDIFKNFFSMPYPIPKLDMVAIPEFSGGAMENYGLITYRETELLQDNLHSTTANKQRLAIVVAHEVAHHWFGNLVTMEWWTHLWLNEGFATWVSYLAIDKLFPEWKIWTRFLQDTNDGLHMDALEQSHPIEVEVHHARSVVEIFDAISYDKGSAVIRMLQNYLGDDTFQKSLGSYIKKYAFKNAKTGDLWSVLSEISGVEVNKIMDTWTKQKGYPVISIKAKDSLLEFEQSQFLLSGSPGDSQWMVPITLACGSYSDRKNFLLETKLGAYDVKNIGNFDENSWIKINIEQTGFYRVKYDENLAARLKNAIEQNFLLATDKFGILDDAYALCVACETTLASLLFLMDVYRKELDYIVLSRLIDICRDVIKVSSEAIPDTVNVLKKIFIRLLLHASEALGWEPIDRESHQSALLREEVLIAMVTFGHDGTQEEAIKRFQAYVDDRNTTLLPADTRKAAYTAVMRNTSNINRNGFDSMLKLYRETDAVQEKTRILRCLASCPDPIIVSEILNFMLSDEVRDQDIIYVLWGVSFEGRKTAWTWVKENWDLILLKWGAGGLLTHFVRDTVTPFCSHEMADEVEAFFASRINPSIAMNLRQSVEQVRIKARWVEHIQQEEALKGLIKQLAGR